MNYPVSMENEVRFQYVEMLFAAVLIAQFDGLSEESFLVKRNRYSKLI